MRYFYFDLGKKSKKIHSELRSFSRKRTDAIIAVNHKFTNAMFGWIAEIRPDEMINKRYCYQRPFSATFRLVNQVIHLSRAPLVGNAMNADFTRGLEENFTNL